jgi:hypothetical protein
MLLGVVGTQPYRKLCSPFKRSKIAEHPRKKVGLTLPKSKAYVLQNDLGIFPAEIQFKRASANSSSARSRPISFTGLLVPASRALAPRQGWRQDQGRGYKLALSGHPRLLLTAKEEEF